MSSTKRIDGGYFISLEGPDCAGKSTQSRMLAAWLRERGHAVLETREPGGTSVGEQLRHIVKHVCGDEAVCDEAELFIFSASRVQLMRKRIMPFLNDGGVVICDRFADSTVAYQGHGRGLDLAMIDQLNSIATVGRWPDMTFLLDLDIDSVMQRGQMRLETLFVQDRIEDESRRFHECVRRGFLQASEAAPDRIKVIAGDASVDGIHRQIVEYVRDGIG